MIVARRRDLAVMSGRAIQNRVAQLGEDWETVQLFDESVWSICARLVWDALVVKVSRFEHGLFVVCYLHLSRVSLRGSDKLMRRVPVQ